MKPRKRYAPRLAADGRPREMAQDVLRACHRYLLDHDPDYRHERLSIETWMDIHHLPHGQLDRTEDPPAATVDPAGPADPADHQQSRQP